MPSLEAPLQRRQLYPLSRYSREGAVVLIVVSALGLFSSIPKYHVLTDVTGKVLGRLIHEQALSEDAAGLSARWHPV